ncbi:MAG TPA: zinc ribbon domain-containing protein [Leptolyngbya sp.]|jgi:putative FmdB family regulatory protein|nr:zinc ribbon domain-containing protein [Leptolyngbya sp.]
MPLYEFKCDPCGVFDQWRSMAESSHPAHCPTCQKPAMRLFSAPMLLTGSFRLSKTVTPEPQLVQRPAAEPIRPKVQSHPGGRPWMIGH